MRLPVSARTTHPANQAPLLPSSHQAAGSQSGSQHVPFPVVLLNVVPTSAVCSVGGITLPALLPSLVRAELLFLLQLDVFPHDPSVQRALLRLYYGLSAFLGTRYG